MANFTALKTAINNAIKTNGNEEITGAVLQVILDAMVETLGESAINNLENALAAEVTNRENAVGSVASDLTAEAEARAALDYQVNNRINQEEYNRQNADAALSQTMSQGFSTLGSQMNALSQAISALNVAYQNGFLYGGVVTPSSSPANGKCFYIALQGGTYTNFGGVGVVQGINILKNDNGWKVEHIYDQTTLLNEFYLLRQQVIQAITSFAPIVIEGDVTNAPDEEDLTSNANHLLQFKNNAYNPLDFSGLGRKYLRKNIAPLSESAAFNGFVEGVTAEETLSGTPEYIFWDRMNTRFVGIKDGVYYVDWSNSDNYIPASTSLVYMYQGTPYKWDGSDFSVDETEVPNLVNCLTQDMINETDTIYIIRYDYTLKEDITIPANCVLEFDGGSIVGAANCTLTMNDCYLQGLSKFNNVVFAGDIKNGMFDVTWIENGNDIGEKINYAQSYFKRLHVPKGSFTYVTPIVIDGIVKLVCDASLKYDGSVVNHGAAFKLKNSGLAYIYIHSLTSTGSARSSMNYAANRTVNFVGINLSSVHSSEIHIDNVSYFNECVRCDDRYAATSGIPFCYNKIYLLLISNFNFGLRFFPMTTYGVSENNVYGGRFTSSGAAAYGGVYNVVIGGSGLDNESYRESGLQDIGVGAIVLDKCCFENHTPLISALLVKDVNGIIVNYCRQELLPKLFTCYGNCRNLINNTKDNSAFFKSDFSQATKLDFPLSYFSRISIDCDSRNMYCGKSTGSFTAKYFPFNNWVLGYVGASWTPGIKVIKEGNYVGNYMGYVGTVIDMSMFSNKILAIETLDRIAQTIIIVFLDEDMKIINSQMTGFHMSEWTYNSTNLSRYTINTTSSIVDLTFDGYKYVFIGLPIGGTEKGLNIYINNTNAIQFVTTPSQGETADRPAAYPLGKPFFDTTIAKPIWWNGTAWVDATGATV